MTKNEWVAEIGLKRDTSTKKRRTFCKQAFSAWGGGWLWGHFWVLTCALVGVSWGCASGTSGQDDDGGVGADTSVQADAELPGDSSVLVDGEVLADSAVEADAEPAQDAEVEIDAELPPVCDDGLMNGDETDVDCGGPDCDPCPDGDGCVDGTDCESGFCDGGICQSPACDDNVLNGDETDVDCGGGTCPGCAAGQNCNFGTDCLSGDCAGGVCQQGDVDPPTIVSITPSDGATGVEKDANIVIQFSEPMDEVNTEGAYSSTDLPPSSVTFSWNLSSDTLTINPINDLAYASGSDPNTVSALEYAFVITTQARDVAGNTLTVARNSSFYTLREITQSLASVSSLTGDVRDEIGRASCRERVCHRV